MAETTTTILDNSTLEYYDFDKETLISLCELTSDLFEFILNGIIVNIIVSFGIFGNIISMIILSEKRMRSSMNILLLGLAGFDTVLIVSATLVFSLPEIYYYTGHLFDYHYYIHPHTVRVLYPLNMIAQTGSVYMTVAITLERYIAVCYPLKVRYMCTCGRAKICVFLVSIFSVIYNVPKFFEVTVDVYRVKYLDKVYCYSLTDLRQNDIYVAVYIHWMYLIFMMIFPFVSLLIMNCSIYKQLRKNNAIRQKLSVQQMEEKGLTIMLFCIVFVFFSCNVLALVLNIMEAFYDYTDNLLAKISNTLIISNSSINFVIYMIFGKKFRNMFLKWLCSNSIIKKISIKSTNSSIQNTSQSPTQTETVF